VSGRLLPPLLAGLLAAGAVAFPRPASADAGGPDREGLVLGAAMGAASLKVGFGGNQFDGTEDTSLGTVALDLQFGGMLHRRIALLFHLNLARGTDDGAVQHLHAVALVGFRLFVTRVFWFELAGGTSGYQARDTLFGDTLEERSSSFAYLLGLGVEIYQGEQFTFDIRANVGFAEYQSGFSASFLQGLVGLNWY